MRPVIAMLIVALVVVAIIFLAWTAYAATIGHIKKLRHEKNHLKAVLNDVERALVMAGPDPYVQRALNFIYLNDDTDKELER